MTETMHTRSRNASLGGLILQLVAFAVLVAVSFASRSHAIDALAWYILGGVPLWFVALLVFRQRELAALESLDLEELRREKQSVGAGEALFDEQAGGGFRVAERRLEWMLRWLVPGAGLISAVYLVALGALLWMSLSDLAIGVPRLLEEEFAQGAEGWAALQNTPIAMVILAILMLGLFLMSRFASGMGRVREWQLLRGCGSFTLGNVLLTAIVVVALGAELYAGVASWEQTLAFAIPIVMIILGLETFANFIFDIYRPRTAGVEARACFDSRLLGLFAEPGGIASSIADAINYQFGFQVSQTWFYQLLQRTFLPMVAVGAVALWLLTSIVIVQPYEHVIVERFGRQLNPGGTTPDGRPRPEPLGPGVHVKLPWPIDVAYVYNTGVLHQISVGFSKYDAEPDYDEALSAKKALLWTDEKHLGQSHFDFLISPPVSQELEETPQTGENEELTRTPVHLLRLDAAIQYRIRSDKLDVYTRAMRDPERTMLHLAWEEVSRYAASATADQLLGQELSTIGEDLRAKIDIRAEKIGLEVVYVGVMNVHPEKTVAEAYRKVVQAEQEKVAAIREALVVENERLAKIAGDATMARELAFAIEQAREAEAVINDTNRLLNKLDTSVVDQLANELAAIKDALQTQIDAELELAQARQHLLQVELELELGQGQTLATREAAAEALEEARETHAAAVARVQQLAAPTMQKAENQLNETAAEALLARAKARVERGFWSDELALRFSPSRLEGEVAGIMAMALSDRWTIELDAARQLAEALNEREAYAAAPEIYKARRTMEVYVEGLKDARKFFLAFDPGDRVVRVRFVAEDQGDLDITEVRSVSPRD